MPTFATQQATSTGVTPTVNNATAAGDKVRPGSILRVFNGGVASTTVTMVSPEVRDGDLAVADRSITVAAGAVKYVYASDYYRNKADGLVTITYSVDTDVDVEVVKS
jgi:hypothetical protein